MTEKILYTCEFCKTDYTDKEKAIECENNHKLVETAVVQGVYKSRASIPTGEPIKIRVKFPGYKDWIVYKR